MIQYQETRKLTKRQKICKAIEGYEICWNMNNSDLQSIANRISNDIDVESNLIFDFLIEKRRESRAERQMEIDRIVREVHNEYGEHSLRWGKHKELTVICERSGVDMKTAKMGREQKMEDDRRGKGTLRRRASCRTTATVSQSAGEILQTYGKMPSLWFHVIVL